MRNGSGTMRATLDGLAKMPTPTMPPATTITASNRPSSRRNSVTLRSFGDQRFELDDGRAVVAPDPECHRRRAAVDEHAPHVGRSRQEIRHELAALRVEPEDSVIVFAARPHVPVLVGGDVVRPCTGRGHLP